MGGYCDRQNSKLVPVPRGHAQNNPLFLNDSRTHEYERISLLVMLYSNGNDKRILRQNCGPWYTHTTPLVWASNSQALFRPNYFFPGLDSCFHSWNPVPYCKDPALLGNNRHFMGKLIQ